MKGFFFAHDWHSGVSCFIVQGGVEGSGLWMVHWLIILQCKPKTSMFECTETPGYSSQPLSLCFRKAVPFTYTELVVNAVDSASASVHIICQDSAAKTIVKYKVKHLQIHFVLIKPSQSCNVQQICDIASDQLVYNKINRKRLTFGSLPSNSFWHISL